MDCNSNEVIVQRGLYNYQKGLVDLISEISKKTGRDDLVLIEVGSYQGESSEIFSKSGKVREIWCIDPWKAGYDENDLASRSDMEMVEKAFDARLVSNPPMKKFKGTLKEFVETQQFKNIKDDVDLIYIDACHTYEGCKNDILTAISAVKPRIAYSGHDFGMAGVTKAVLEVLGKPDMVFVDSSWLKFCNLERL